MTSIILQSIDTNSQFGVTIVATRAKISLATFATLTFTLDLLTFRAIQFWAENRRVFSGAICVTVVTVAFDTGVGTEMRTVGLSLASDMARGCKKKKYISLYCIQHVYFAVHFGCIGCILVPFWVHFDSFGMDFLSFKSAYLTLHWKGFLTEICIFTVFG